MARLRRLAALCTVPAAALLLSGCAEPRTDATTLIVGEKPGHVRAGDEPARALSFLTIRWGRSAPRPASNQAIASLRGASAPPRAESTQER